MFQKVKCINYFCIVPKKGFNLAGWQFKFYNAQRQITVHGNHYDESRYHALNLHSVFSKGTIEFRLFNSTLHAGEVKSYIQLCLAISHQALVQKSASRARTTSENEKYTFRTWLLRLGMIGDEFKTARHHLLKRLDGNIAWKDPSQAERQKERLAARRTEELLQGGNQNEASEESDIEPQGEDDQDDSPAMTM